MKKLLSTIFSILVLTIPLKAIPWSPDSWQETETQQIFNLNNILFSGNFNLQTNFFNPQDDCLNTSAYMSIPAPTSQIAVIVTTCDYAGDYSTVTDAVAGTEYTFFSSISTDYLTIRQGTYNGAIIGQGTQPVTAAVTVSGKIFVHVNTDSDCGTEDFCRTISVNCSSCAPETDYCEVTSTNTSYGISSFSTSGGEGNISNTSGSGTYTDYSDQFVSQKPGESVDFSILPVQGTNGFAIWVDWNNDFVFDADERMYNSNDYIEEGTGSIIVPSGTEQGDYRMRVVSNWLASSPLPCGDLGGANYGEAEDYTFRVLEGDDDGDDPDYCTPEGTNSSRYIDNFSTTGGLENISNLNSGFSDGGYGDFHETMGVEQIQGQNISFTADIMGGTAGFRIWVDWNQDGEFDPENEVAYQSSSYQSSQTGTVTVPTTALTGTTRMRIVSHWLSSVGNVDPCATGFTYGEFEDYSFTIVEMADCSGTPDGGTVTVTPATGNPDSNYTVSASGYTVANGISYLWQSNTDGAGWVDEGTASSIYADFVATAPSEIDVTVEWRLEVSCEDSGESVFSDVGSFTTSINYCEPSATFPEAITLVQFAGIDNASAPDSEEDYEDFTSIVGTVNPDTSEDITLKGNTNGDFENFFTVWIDWNQNGTFEPTEMNEIGSIVDSDGTDDVEAVGIIDIPADALLGMTKMRVIKNYNQSPTDPCGNYLFGQIEDYSINVTDGGTSGAECSQGVPSFATVPNAYNITNGNAFYTADDFIVDGNFSMNKISIDTNQQGVPETTIITVYEDNGGKPGAVKYTVNMNPTTSTVVGSAFGDPIYHSEYELATPLAFGPGTYWLAPKMSSSSGETMWLAVTDQASWGAAPQRSTDDGVSWAADTSGMNVVMMVYGICSDPENCSGTPDTGTITVNPEVGNAGSSYTVSSSGYSFGNGLIYQWQSNTDGAGWIDEGPLMDSYASYNATAPDEEGMVVEWKLIVSCTLSGESAESNIATFTVEKTYCHPKGTNPDRYINDFVTTQGVENINNSNSGYSPDGYGDFYDTMGASQIIGQPVNFNANFMGGTFGFRIWVDWNQNGTFEESEVAFASSNGYQASYGGSFSVPTDAMMGETRMRIGNHWLDSTGPQDPCMTFTYGEFEDYKFTVLPMEDCSGTPEGGTVTVTPAVANPGDNYTVSAADYSVGNGLTYQWQSNTDDAGWANEGDALEFYADYIATAPAVVGTEVEWRLEVTCANSGETSLSGTDTFTTGIVYCEPTFSFVEPISRVVFSDIDNSSDPNSNSPYEDFTSIVGNVTLTETYEIALEGNTAGSWTNYFTVWIDWNQNGTFETTEMYEIGSITNSTGTDGQQAIGAITVPEGAAIGETRMRVIKNFYTSPLDPCGSYSYGQAEDYTINVESLGVNEMSAASFAYWPNPVKDVLNISSEKTVRNVDVFNLAGQRVMLNAKVVEGQVDVSDLSTGTYVFRVTMDDNRVKTFKVIKK